MKQTIKIKKSRFSTSEATAEVIKKNKHSITVKLLSDWSIYCAGEIITFKYNEVEL